jgi:hypothetical protein
MGGLADYYGQTKQNAGTLADYYGGGTGAGQAAGTTDVYGGGGYDPWAANVAGAVTTGNMSAGNSEALPPAGDGAGGGDGYNPDEISSMITQLFGDLLGEGPRDTADDEELIRQMMAGEVGGSLADLNARMGGMGFGDSGAAMNLSGDIYQRGARQASEDIMGLRQRSRDDYQDQIAQAAQILFGERELGMSEDFYSQMQDYINSLLPGEDEGGGGAGEEESTWWDAMNPANWAENPADTAANYLGDALEAGTGSEVDLPSGTDAMNATLGAGGGVQFLDDDSQIPEGFTPMSDEPTFLPGIGKAIVYFGPNGEGGTQLYVVRY